MVCGKHTVHLPGPLGHSVGDLQVCDVEKGLIMRVKEVQMLQSQKEEKKMFPLPNNFPLILNFFVSRLFLVEIYLGEFWTHQDCAQ